MYAVFVATRLAISGLQTSTVLELLMVLRIHLKEKEAWRGIDGIDAT
jgi:hypothetical protein